MQNGLLSYIRLYYYHCNIVLYRLTKNNYFNLIKLKMIDIAEKEGSLQLKGNTEKCGAAIEKYLSTIKKGFNFIWSKLFRFK